MGSGFEGAARDDPAAPPDACAADEMIEGLAYEAALTGAAADGDAELAELLHRSSILIGRADQPPRSRFGLAQRARRDRARLREVLRSRGYYAGTVAIELPPAAAGSPVAVAIEVTPGPRYRLGEVAIKTVAAEGRAELIAGIAPADLGLETGASAVASRVVEAERALIGRLEARGRLFAAAADRRVVVRHAEHRVDVTLIVDPGPAARLGPVEIAGLESLEADFIRRRLGLDPGSRLTPQRLDAARARLRALEVFDRIDLRPGSRAEAELLPETADAVRVPVDLHLEEADSRSLGATVALATSEGVRASSYWMHRNFLGRAEQLRLELEGRNLFLADVGDPGAEAMARFRKPDFLRRRQSLELELTGVTERPEAFDRDSGRLTATLDRPLWSDWQGSFGLGVEVEQITDFEDTDTRRLVWLPASLSYDSRDDPLDPTAGARLDLGTEIYSQALGADDDFLIAETGGAVYRDLMGDERMILAARARLGALLAEDLADVPADRRFFAGGGGSVRGFGYQLVGPLDADDMPEGGRSLAELSFEARLRLTENVGLVPFVDAGQVYRTVLPQIGEDFRFGVGAGLRYHTPVGPLRLDVALPVDKREVDDSFEIYLSIGQAF